MAGPKDVSVRRPAVAGRFYPADPQQCRATARALLEAAGSGSVSAPASSDPGIVAAGAIVPHAGWICSGAIAAEAVAAVARAMQAAPPQIVVVFGAVHTPVRLDRAALDNYSAWEMPGGPAQESRDIVQTLANARGEFLVDDRLHLHEHAIEVELPFIQEAWPEAALVPIEVPLIEAAADIGRQTAQHVMATGKRAVFLASSDLTHYGPAYHFTPAGVGLEALRWAKQNDERLLRLVTEMAIERVVPEVRAHGNACGGGAIAAMLAACKECGATHAALLRHANSYQTLAGRVPDDPSNAVGYAAAIVR